MFKCARVAPIPPSSHPLLPFICAPFALAQARDDQEGADFLMVKPGMMYLDIIRDVRNAVGVGSLTLSSRLYL